MISFFRNIFKSKIGLFFTFLLIAVIALAFAAADITGSTFGGVAGNDRVAVVGDTRVTTSEVTQSANNALRGIQQQQPTMTMQMLVEQGGYETVLDQVIDQAAIGAYAREYGLRAGTNMVNSELLNEPAFYGPSGEFDTQTYQLALSRANLTDAVYRQNLTSSLLNEMLVGPALRAPQMPEKLLNRYASLLNERRQGSIVLIPSAAFAPEDDPTDEQLQSFYEESRANYIRPERRVLRYAGFGAANITARTEPTDEEIAERYEENSANFSAQETRTISSFFVPTRDAALAIRDAVETDTTLLQAARDAGFSVTVQEDVTRESLANLTNTDVADAVFATNEGEIAEPARSPLGWYVARVDEIIVTQAQTLADARPQIVEELRTELRETSLGDLSARIEDEVAAGTSLAEVVDAFDLTIQVTPALLADGRVFDNPGQSVSQNLQPVLETAFQMDEAEPQLAEVVRGEQFIVFEVGEIVPSAAPPLAEIRGALAAAWKRSEGAKLAKDAADRVLERVADDGTLADAVGAEETDLPNAQPIDIARNELQLDQAGGVPPALALMFSMAQGTAKKLEARSDLGWFVVLLDKIVAVDVADDLELKESIRQVLQPAIADEYDRQLLAAIRADTDIERNEDAIEAVRKVLIGEN